jgi:hypothetical protein
MILRGVVALVVATAYQVATNPFLQAVLLAACGHWQVGAALLFVYLALCALAVTMRERRYSRLSGLEEVEIVTAPEFLFIFGDEQQGWLPQWLVDKWPQWVPRWWIAFSCCAWRNKLRNLPFSAWLWWLHRPRGELVVRQYSVGKLTVIMRTRGWMCEIEYLYGRRFGDVGPRLDQPDQWGGVSWAFRPWGKF